MRLSPRERYVVTVMLMIVVALAIGIAAGELEQYQTVLMLTFFGWVAVCSLLLFSIRCPKCHTSIMYQGKAGRLSLYAGIARRHCQNCGEDLSNK